MKFITETNFKKLLVIPLSVLLATSILVSCGSDDDDDDNARPQNEQNAGPLGPDAIQVERLARPAINEALLISNDFLNAFNMIPPSADLSAAAAPVLAEAVTVLDAFDQIDEKEDISIEAVTTAFLPDVMRIDTRVDIGPGKTAYNADVSGDKGMLTGGRKIEDDVIDITLSLLVAGDPTGMTVKDNVSYDGKSGNSAQPGHRRLYRQSSPKGAASFPFLARPF